MINLENKKLYYCDGHIHEDLSKIKRKNYLEIEGNRLIVIFEKMLFFKTIDQGGKNV